MNQSNISASKISFDKIETLTRSDIKTPNFNHNEIAIQEKINDIRNQHHFNQLQTKNNKYISEFETNNINSINSYFETPCRNTNIQTSIKKNRS